MIVASPPRFGDLERVLQGATGSVFTGAVARIEQGGRVVFERAYGATRADRLAQPVVADSRFDLASLTKLFVATLALRAVQTQRLQLDAPLVQWFAQWQNSARSAITLRMLLAHTSGMNSGADYRELLEDNVVRFALDRDLAAPPQERVIYSDLGFIALGELLERVHGISLAALMRALRPSCAYRPPAGQQRSIPATEDDGWRGRVQGVVHDEKAYLMGGVAGHAGLFGSASDVAWLAEQYLGPLQGRSGSVLERSTVREATKEQADDPVLRRALGWALKTTDDNSCGRLFSRDSFGHTGFVGTCVWADPQRDCSAVLLTNSVYFGRSDTRDVRAAFCESAIEALDR